MGITYTDSEKQYRTTEYRTEDSFKRISDVQEIEILFRFQAKRFPLSFHVLQENENERYTLGCASLTWNFVANCETVSAHILPVSNENQK